MRRLSRFFPFAESPLCDDALCESCTICRHSLKDLARTWEGRLRRGCQVASGVRHLGGNVALGEQSSVRHSYNMH